MKFKSTIAGVLVALAALPGCGSEANDSEVVSRNLSTAADNFEVNRRVVFINGITDEYLLEIEGRCSITDDGRKIAVTCKLGPDEYKKHFLGLSDNVTYLVEQMAAIDVSEYRYRVVFKPSVLIPDVDVDLGGN